jgi:ABC-type polysaccharide/polyol phosphate export permease
MIFRKAANFMLQMRLEHSIFVFQSIYRETLILVLYQLFVIPLVFIIRGEEMISWMWSWVFLGYLIIILIGFFASFWIGWLATRYRDVQPMLTSIITILFLITPVLWPPPENFANSLYFQLNPFYHLLELIRSPIINGVVPLTSWLVALGLLILNVLISIIFYSKVKNRLVLWL